jgi:hypothetical protein
MNPDAEDNHLPELYEQIKLGMTRVEVRSILGEPNSVVVGFKVGKLERQTWVDMRRTLLVDYSEEHRVIRKELHDARQIIAHEP